MKENMYKLAFPNIENVKSQEFVQDARSQAAIIKDRVVELGCTVWNAPGIHVSKT
jgi:hypothetical protein